VTGGPAAAARRCYDQRTSFEGPPILIRLLLCLSVALTGAGAVHGDTAEALRVWLEGLDAGGGAEVHGEPLHHPDLVAGVYRDRDHRPLWTGDGPLAGQRAALAAAVEASALHGLNPAAYHADALATVKDPLAIELLATDAFLTQARHRATGAVSPRALDPEWFLIAPEVDARALLDLAARGEADVGALLEDLWPDNDEYRRLLEERARILALGETSTARVPAGPLIRPGDSGERVLALKERLLGPGEHTPIYDTELGEAVRAFQRGAGLEPDGIVGPASLEVMNASRFSWIDRIDANLERWRWLPAHQPDTYLRVNIAAFSLRVIQANEDALRMDVIVGRPYRRTPVFTETIKYLVLNPDWNVPWKIAVQDKLPDLKADASKLAAQGYEVRLEGSDTFVPVDQVDWTPVTRGNFRHLLRQRPGPMNALGQVKFMLPNPHAVYLHDTPNRDLFAKQERGFSSGCVRLSRPLELADWLLRNDGQTSQAARIRELLDGGETTTIYLRQPLPTYLVYFTAFTDEAGEVIFRRDLYERDGAIVAALRAGGRAGGSAGGPAGGLASYPAGSTGALP